MANVYLSVEDVEKFLHTTYDEETDPSVEELEDFITLAEEEFENEVGVYTLRTATEYLRASVNGVYLSNKPKDGDVNVYRSNGQKINPEFTELDEDSYMMSYESDYLLLLQFPEITNIYKVEYETGYDYEDMPLNIKYLVFLYLVKRLVVRNMSKQTGDDSIRTIDVEVYRQVTNSNPYKGFTELNKMIEKEKKALLKKGNLKVINKWNG